MIDLRSLARDIFDEALQGLGAGAAVVESKAKARAPVRNIFSDGSYSIRFKSAQEIKKGVAIRRALSLSREGGPNNPAPVTAYPMEHWGKPSIRQKRPPRHWQERRFAESQRLLHDYSVEMNRRSLGGTPSPVRLSRRGAYEVRTQRAAYVMNGRRVIGGRLRGEITASPPNRRGFRATAWVISPTPYAKYQEFGTRHNAAHPYLRPALAESQEEVVGLIADAVRSALSAKAGKTDIEIVVRL